MDIVVDRSFIKDAQHEVFWRELLRTYLQNKFRGAPLGIPEDWEKQKHIFVKKYSGNNDQLDLTSLFREHTYFADSKDSEGLQIADICAHICLRYHRREAWYEAYRLLRPFIVGPQGSPMTALVPVGELDFETRDATKTQKEVLAHAKKIVPRLRKHT